MLLITGIKRYFINGVGISGWVSLGLIGLAFLMLGIDLYRKIRRCREKK